MLKDKKGLLEQQRKLFVEEVQIENDMDENFIPDPNFVIDEEEEEEEGEDEASSSSSSEEEEKRELT